jgi:protein TonB
VNAGKTEFAAFFAFATLAHAALILSLKLPDAPIVLTRPNTILFRFDQLVPQPAAPAHEASAPSPASTPAAAARSGADAQHESVAKTKVLSHGKPKASVLAESKSSEPRSEKGEEAPTSREHTTTAEDQREQRRPAEETQSQVASLPRVASSPVAMPRTETASAEVSMETVRVSYEQVLAAWLDRHKYYPPPLRRRGFEGSGEMRIRIDRHGTILYAAMSKPLPYTTLDEVALDWAQRANPFPELPESIEGESYEFLAPVTFAIR